MLSLVTEDPQHAPSIQEAPPLGRSCLDRDRPFAADVRPRADVPDRLRDPLVFVWRLACFPTMRKGSSRIHPTHHALASGTAASNLALSYGRVL
jgi:hypothetical protein